ncbi:MAG TPA: TIGR03668 family PPOX class F420-dependent oxidoreductase [Candidatus Limnocylindrales bacterium]|nr:TIGR03668 family PPOX class F420-dependent oxidoreductase [Candidatus Limnocylindrales bacterium]
MLERQRRARLADAAAARVARLATADAAGRPHLVPICFAILGERLYSVIDDKPKPTRTQLKRLRNIAENAHVAVLVDHFEEDWSRLWFTSLSGTARVVGDGEEYERALRALRAKYRQYESMPLAMSTHPMIAVDIDRVHGWSAAERH